MKKGTKFYSVLKGKCPQCQQGEFFKGSFFKGTPKQKCSKCGLKFYKEPGFYQGSYYVSYALGVAAFVTMWVATSVLFPNMNFNLSVGVIIGGILVMVPFMYPLSKIIWANIFFRYKKDAVSRNTNP